MADLFWAYWDASVRFALLSVVILAALPVLRRWITPKLLCWAWALLILRLSLPLSLPFSGSIFNLSERLRPSTWTNALRNGVIEAGWGETLAPTLRTQDELVKSALVGFSWENALVALWIAGTLLLFARLAVNAVRLHRFFARAERQNSGRLYEIFKDVRRRFGIHANVPLLVSDDVRTPGIAGIFNPRVVIPRPCAEDLDDEEIRCVLLHELTHYRRGDLFLHHMLMLICFIHWYNPLVWLLFRQFKVSMEQACDFDVINTESITTAREYGLTLVQVMRRCRGSLASPAGALCLLGNRKSSALKQRIRLIAAPRPAAPALLCAGLSLFGASFVYSITGEAEVEREGERLLGLTRFPGAAFFRASVDFSNRQELNEISFFEGGGIRSPRSWIKEVNVSNYQGQEVVAWVKYRLNAPQSRQEFWITVKNASGRVIATARAAGAAEDATRFQRLDLRLGLAQAAATLDYGLSSDAEAGVWLESFELLPAGRIAARE